MAHHPKYSGKLKPCRDQRFYNFLKQASSFLDDAHLNYVAFGSVAVCTWLPYAPFLPKDLDVIVDAPAWHHLQAACWEWSLPLNQQEHFASIDFGHYEVNLVPQHCRIFPWRSDEVIGGYDLSLAKLEVSERELHMLPISETISFPVPRPEYLLVPSMRVFGFNTDSMARALALLSSHDMDTHRLIDFLARTENIIEPFAERMITLEQQLTPHDHPALTQICKINAALMQYMRD